MKRLDKCGAGERRIKTFSILLMNSPLKTKNFMLLMGIK
jgi:hypothetical protein